MIHDYKALLEPLTRLRGVRGAMVVAADDGVIVVDALMDGMKGKALAALAAALASRVVDLSTRASFGPARFIQLQAAEGSLLLVPASEELLLVTVTGRDVPLGLTRLEMLKAAERMR
ncbi:MAG TPA: roadblock/LC7 domain-containing protein [Gemmatimonadales bacterium]|nr:roadblock/LC7 domain-containing protein [Gemmatimonadales bacterium]